MHGSFSFGVNGNINSPIWFIMKFIWGEAYKFLWTNFRNKSYPTSFVGGLFILSYIEINDVFISWLDIELFPNDIINY